MPFYPVRRDTSIDDLSPIEFEALHTVAESADIVSTTNLSGNSSQGPSPLATIDGHPSLTALTGPARPEPGPSLSRCGPKHGRELLVRCIGLSIASAGLALYSWLPTPVRPLTTRVRGCVVALHQLRPNHHRPKNFRISVEALTCCVVNPMADLGFAPGQEWPPPMME
jgi:hypothetical protein